MDRSYIWVIELLLVDEIEIRSLIEYVFVDTGGRLE